MEKTFTVYIEEKRSRAIEVTAVTEDEALVAAANILGIPTENVDVFPN